MNRMIDCRVCNGTGKLDCKPCHATGMLKHQFTQIPYPCPTCEARGWIKCPQDNGTGRIRSGTVQ